MKIKGLRNFKNIIIGVFITLFVLIANLFLSNFLFEYVMLSNDSKVEVSAYSGSGTSSDPYIINNKSTLKSFASDVSEGNTFNGKYFKLTANIDFRDQRESNRDDYYMSFSGIGVLGHGGSRYTWAHSVPFCGTFDGGWTYSSRIYYKKQCLRSFNRS